MINKNVFIQNLKDASTVLQQLQICIDEVKTVIDECNSYIATFNEQIALVDEKIASIEYPPVTYGVNINGASESTGNYLIWNIDVFTYNTEYVAPETYIADSITNGRFKINSLRYFKDNHGSLTEVIFRLDNITITSNYIITLELYDIVNEDTYEVELNLSDESLEQEFVYK